MACKAGTAVSLSHPLLDLGVPMQCLHTTLHHHRTWLDGLAVGGCGWRLHHLEHLRNDLARWAQLYGQRPGLTVQPHANFHLIRCKTVHAMCRAAGKHGATHQVCEKVQLKHKETRKRKQKRVQCRTGWAQGVQVVCRLSVLRRWC